MAEPGGEPPLELAQGPSSVSRFTRWFRSPLFNVIIVGLISFTQPGIWNALNSTGAGGQQSPYLVNGANALTFGIMVFGCSIFAALANRWGLKKVLIIGTLGYAPYSAALYVNNRYGVQWFVLFGGATCGIAASALWATEGAIAIGYSSVKDRGRFTGLWLGLRELGQIIGASIELSLNYKNVATGKVGYSTYLVLIGIQCLGLPLALLISPPEKIIRPDGVKLKDPTKNKAVLSEFRRLWAVVKKKQFFLLIPVMIGYQWNGTYQGIYLTDYFSVRARTLGSLVAALMGAFANAFWGFFYDSRVLGRPTLAKASWAFFSIMMLACLSWQVANERTFSTTVPKITIDWLSPQFGRAFAVNVIFRFLNESSYMFVYWLMGAFFDDLETLTIAIGLLRSFESVGSAIAYGVGASSASPLTNLTVAFVMFGICIPFTTAAVLLVPEYPVDATKPIGEGASGKQDSGDETNPVIVAQVAAAIDGPKNA
ncbi:major facilitator superfamily domain-containing protein [Xylariales sp. PMI_506]|nr:major facilitator superfamily domain-containing protein [Xylariales sp. PMI_506]